jgi:hypothetical protein
VVLLNAVIDASKKQMLIFIMAKRIFLIFWILIVVFCPWTLQLPQLLILKTRSITIAPVSSLSEQEIHEINKLQGLHNKSAIYKLLGKISWNKPVVKLEKFFDNWFLLLDPNFYFFREHPRERAGVGTVEKLPSSCLVLFLLGIYLMRKNRQQVISWLVTGLTISFGLAFFGMIDSFISWLMLLWLSFPIVKAFGWLWQEKRKICYLLIVIYLFQLTYWWINFHA